MKGNEKLIIAILGIIILALSSWLYNIKTNEPIKVTYNYETQFKKLDIQYKERLRQLDKILKAYNEAPPKVIREYITEKPTYIINNYTDTIIQVTDTIKGDTVIISNDFLTLYPRSPKLLDFELNRDVFMMTTLGIDADIKESEWPMDFDNYTYFYSDGKLNYKRVRKPNNKDSWKNLWLGFGYETINQIPYLSTEYYLPLGNRFRLKASFNAYISDEPFYIAPVGLNYRLLK